MIPQQLIDLITNAVSNGKTVSIYAVVLFILLVLPQLGTDVTIIDPETGAPSIIGTILLALLATGGITQRQATRKLQNQDIFVVTDDEDDSEP